MADFPLTCSLHGSSSLSFHSHQLAGPTAFATDKKGLIKGVHVSEVCLLGAVLVFSYLLTCTSYRLDVICQ